MLLLRWCPKIVTQDNSNTFSSFRNPVARKAVTKGFEIHYVVVAITRLQTASMALGGALFRVPTTPTKKHAKQRFFGAHTISLLMYRIHVFLHFEPRELWQLFFPCFYEHENVRLTRKIGRVDTLFWIVIFRELRWLAVFPAYRNYICTVLT